MPCLPLVAAAAAFTTLPALLCAQAPDWTAPPGQSVLDTDSTTLATSSGPVTVAGGVFRFDTVTIPANATVRATGSRPMVWIVDTMVVDGVLDVSGEDGAAAELLNAANIPTLGGRGGPAGGRGGNGSPQIGLQSLSGQPGNGPGNTPAFGGGGGLLSFVAACQRGSGGGGGAFATAGDPHYKAQAGAGTSFVQRAGVGGFGCIGASGSAARTLQGGGPGGLLMLDGRTDNDFLGLAYDVAGGQVVAGELLQLVGGAGGGGGGDLSHDGVLLSPTFVEDSRGGGGGGGGGCLVIAAQTLIRVGPAGRIAANGGHGGGGEWVGSSARGAGGGGGSGGLVILATLGTLELHVKGETYANNDFDFVVAADGGVSTTGAFFSPVIRSKYPTPGFPASYGIVYDSLPLGGFGGMGIVQFVTRIGTNADGTNTVLDDNIQVVRNGVTLAGAQKRRFLAWRGFRNAQGVYVDDFGQATLIGADEGDIRPAPHLLPIF